MSLVHSKIWNGKGYLSLDEIIEEFSKKFPHIYSVETDIQGRMSRQQKQKLITKINRRVLEKLEAKGYIERDKVGRNTILRLTELGEFFALLETGLN
ncbi:MULTISPECIES: DUF6293 family protein [unclassified Archaeoglobus]|uniref:DUF6293 family protein n=1 Tax=unclassified Archaeoglobus TaxID=2643606 RepID=UPI00373FDD9C